MKNKIHFLIYLLICANTLFAQQSISIHQLEWKKHKNSPTDLSLIGDSSKDIIPLMTRKNVLNTTVFGYLPYWSSSDYLQYSLLSHIAAFGVGIKSNGALGNTHGWPWTALINTAHTNGVKVILTAVLFDGDDIHSLITTPAYKNNFFQNMKNLILQSNLDGLNIDFESLNNTDKGANIVNFMSDLTTYLHTEIPGSEVSFAGPAVNWGSYWDLTGLANACDYIFIMGYAFAGSWNSNSGPMAPLTGGSINITNTINTQYGVISQNSPEKLILGLPYYGYHWTTSSGQPRASTLSNIGSVFYEAYHAGVAAYGQFWDVQSQSPWYRFNDGDNWHQIWCDDDSSLGLKYQLAQNKNLKGVGMWALAYDGVRMELWQELYNRFGSGPMPPPNTPESFRIMGEDASSLKVSFLPSSFATHYYVYLSNDGVYFPDSIQITSKTTAISGLETDSLYFIRVRAANDSTLSNPTEVLAAIPSINDHQVLIVNGFDRQNGTNNPLNYLRQHAQAIQNNGKAFSSTSNDAVISGKISLNNFEMVDWILGDESTIDETFNFKEQVIIAEYLRGGGKLFISGSEIGWDLSLNGYTADNQFYTDYLNAQYVADAPLGQSSTYYSVEPISGDIFDGIATFNFDNGTHGTYNVDWPDAITAINGGKNCLLYSGISPSDGVAGIYYDGLFPGGNVPGRLLYFAFPFETVYPEAARDTLMYRIFTFFESPINNIMEEMKAFNNFVLYQNYPNPFNSVTTIAYEINQPEFVEVSIYNIQGQLVETLINKKVEQGYHKIIWDASAFSSGLYYFKIKAGRRVDMKKCILIK